MSGADPQLLAGRAAVVVGGSRGIGAAVAAALAAHGAAVVVNGRNRHTAENTAARINAEGGRALAHPGSPSDERSANALVATCNDEFGGIDILVNCAGMPSRRARRSLTSPLLNSVSCSTLTWARCSPPAVRRRRSWPLAAAAASSTPDLSPSSVITAAPAIPPARAP